MSKIKIDNEKLDKLVDISCKKRIVRSCGEYDSLIIDSTEGAETKATRPCLRCGKNFFTIRSKRICRACRKKESNKSAGDFVGEELRMVGNTKLFGRRLYL